MTQNIKISSLEERHLDGIIEIENDCFSPPWTRDAYKSEINRDVSEYVILEQDGIVVGYGGFRQAFDGADITNIAVRKEFRNMGLGKLIMRELTERAKKRNVRSLTLEVRVGNMGARALYEKSGFVSLGVRPGFYQDGEDALIMEKHIE